MARKEFIRGQDIKCEIFCVNTENMFKNTVDLQQAIAITHNINIEDDRYFNSEAPTITGTANGGEARITVPREQEMLVERVLMGAASQAATAFAFDAANRLPIGFVANWTNPDTDTVDMSWVCIPGICGIGDAGWDDAQGKATREYAIRSPNIIEGYLVSARVDFFTCNNSDTAFSLSVTNSIVYKSASRRYAGVIAGNPLTLFRGSNYFPPKSIKIVSDANITATNATATTVLSVTVGSGTANLAIVYFSPNRTL
jgi:hypothetical protein